MRVPGERLGWLLVLCGGYMSACAPDPEVDSRALSLQELPSCLLSGDSVTVTALGAFAPRAETIDVDAVATLSDFPVGTRELGFSMKLDAGRTALGLALVGGHGQQAQAAWLLPQQRSCPLGDPLALALPGSAVAALPSGGVLVAGGRSADGVLSSAFEVQAGAQLAQAVPEGMLLRRMGASATLAGDIVLVAGGAADDSGAAQETFEVYEPQQHAFARERSQKLLGGPRMDHGAALLPSGAVLLVGGRAEVSGAALASAELVDPETGERTVIEGSAGLRFARAQPTVLVLDDGQVLVVGGVDEVGGVVPQVERFSGRSKRFETLSVKLPKPAELRASALPGGRVVWVACDDSSTSTSAPEFVCEAGLLLQNPASGDFESLPLAVDFLGQAAHGLHSVRVLSLSDGRVLLTGRDPQAAISSRAFVLEVGQATLEKREASRVPTVLIPMRDGAVAELDALGMSLRRETLGSAYAAVSGNLVDSLRQLALDAPSNWTKANGSLRAEHDDARLDLAGLRYAEVRVRLQAEGAVTLVLHDGAGAAREARLENGKLRAEGCQATLPKTAELVATRRGKSLQLAAAGDATACTIAVPAGELSVAVRADTGSTLTKLTIERL